MKLTWKHLELYFYEADNEQYPKLIELINSLKKRLHPKRIFWLFEDVPHLFIAFGLDQKGLKEFEKLEEDAKLGDFKTPVFVSWYEFKDSTDGENGKVFVDLMNTYACHILNKNKSDFTHIIHCILNMSGVNLDEELRLYKLLEKKMRFVLWSYKINNSFKKVMREITKFVSRQWNYLKQ